MPPKVSICVPIYNGEKFLQDALDSISAQSFRDFEVVISDNNSTDKSLEIVQEWKRHQDFPVFIYSNPEMGIGNNWNFSIKKAQGEFIKLLFQDDFLEPNALERALEYTQYNGKTYRMIFSKRHIIATDSEYSRKWKSENADLQRGLRADEKANYSIDKQHFKEAIFYKKSLNVFGEPSAAFIHRSVFEDIGYFHPQMRQLLDLEFYHRFLKKEAVLIVNEKWVNFRIHENQATFTNLDHSEDERKNYIKRIPIRFFAYLPWKKIILQHLKKLFL